MSKVKKQEIINTAIDLFAAEGVNKVFVETIAEKLGSSKGKIYHYFKHGKKDIINEILRDYESYISNCVPNPKEWEAEGANAEKILFKLFFQFPKGDMLRYRKIVHIILSGMHENDQLKKYAVEFFVNDRERLITECLSTLSRNGKIVHLPLAPESAARFFNRYMMVCAMLDSTRYPYTDDAEKADALQAEVVHDCTDFIYLLLGKVEE